MPFCHRKHLSIFTNIIFPSLTTEVNNGECVVIIICWFLLSASFSSDWISFNCSLCVYIQSPVLQQAKRDFCVSASLCKSNSHAILMILLCASEFRNVLWWFRWWMRSFAKSSFSRRKNHFCRSLLLVPATSNLVLIVSFWVNIWLLRISVKFSFTVLMAEWVNKLFDKLVTN